MGLARDTHDVGPFFWTTTHTLKKRSDILHFAPVNEIEHPYRHCRSLVLRLPFTSTGIVFGKWKNTGRDEEEALLSVLGFEMSYKEVNQRHHELADELEDFDAESV